MVAPKKAALKEAEASYEIVMVSLRAKQAELKVASNPPCWPTSLHFVPDCTMLTTALRCLDLQIFVAECLHIIN